MTSEKDDLLADLTPAQVEAVTHMEGPLLILAGAGSGKTRVITRRVAWLLRQEVRPSSILAITFTNKAAGEMKQRVEMLVPGSRVWISTFHAFGARFLRMYADRIGIDKNFTIYDQDDRTKLIKLVLEDVGLEEGRFSPASLQGAISKAKNQLQGPDQYAKQAYDYFAQVVASVYPAYEKRLRTANAFDFDDLLYWPAMVLKNNAELRSELDSRFRYVMVDEYQDTNQAQYALIRSLSVDYPNICTVGDPDQCLPAGTLIQTPTGPKPVEEIRELDQVVAGTGWGRTDPMVVDKVMINPYKGILVNIHVQGGITLRATPNHLCFARIKANEAVHYVYLMWKRGVGYRLGTTRGVRASKDGVIVSGLQVRTNQEVADAIWLVKYCSTSAEARFYEQYLSVLYGIPTMVFFVRGRQMDFAQEWVDRLYRDIDTKDAAAQLMADHYLDMRYPHHRPGAVTRSTWSRKHVLFTMFGDPRPGVTRLWHEHRVQLVTSDPLLRVKAEAHFKVRNGSRGTWRIETSRKDYEAGMRLANDIAALDPDMEVIPRARFTSEKAFGFYPASHLHPGMVVPVHVDGMIQERVIEAVAWEHYEGPVYDLSVPHARNYIAGGVIVHNSIYGWRGSDIRNILDFERDFPNARVLTLSQNYRSTKAILHAASHLIASNRKRKPKDLVTENRDGLPVRVLTFDDGNREAEGIAKLIRDNVQKYGRNFRDHAVFVRINALTRGLEQVFVKERVPFQIVRGLAFFDRKENKDVLGYLRLLLNPQDDLSFERVVNEPPRGIGKVSLEHLRAYAAPREMSMLAASADVARIKEIKGKASKGLAQFSAMMTELSKMLDRPPHDVIREVLAQSGYRNMLIDSREDEEQDRLANVEELITAARQFYEQDESRTLADFLENVTLVSDVDGWDEASDCVSVMTMHAAKGLEFPVVCVMAIEQGILPHERSLAKEDQVEEERRLLFVGMTRAKEELYLMHARLREFRGSTMYSIPSMFLEELPPEVERADVSGGMRPAGMERWRGGGSAAQEGWREAGVGPRATDDYAEGVQVRHERYGLGRVIEVGGQGALRKVRVRFAKAGERTFLVSKAELEIVRPGPQA